MELIDILGILADVPIPLACLMDIFLLTTFVHDKTLCPVFSWCLRNIFLTHLVIYFVEIFIRDFAANGILIAFFQENQKIVGKIFFAVAVVWSAQIIHWNTIMGISRLWCVVGSISFKRYLDSQMRLIISSIVWGFNLILCLHIFIFIDCRSWPMGENSISFGTVTPNIVTTLYVSYAQNVSLFITLIAYGWLVVALLGRKTIPTQVARRILVAQFLINMPKLLSCFVTIYGQLQAFVLPTVLPEMNLKLYWFLAQLGGVGYGINATIVVFICFPQARKRLRQMVYRKGSSSTKVTVENSQQSLPTKDIVTIS